MPSAPYPSGLIGPYVAAGRKDIFTTSLVGERRCPECKLFMHALGVGGVCIHCDDPRLWPNFLMREVLRCSAKSALPLSGRF